MNNLNLYRSLGSQLIYEGKWFLNKATPVKKVRFGANSFYNTISNITSLPISKIYSADSYHDTTDMDTWKLVIEGEWSNKKTWIAETFDCDNFAGTFSNHAADVYGLNSCGRITVALYHPGTDRPIKDSDGKDSYHRACIIIDSKLDCYLLETQSDLIVKMEKGKYPVIGNWEYRPSYIDIN